MRAAPKTTKGSTTKGRSKTGPRTTGGRAPAAPAARGRAAVDRPATATDGGIPANRLLWIILGSLVVLDVVLGVVVIAR